MSDGPENKRNGRPRINPPGPLDQSDPSYLQQCGFALGPSIDGLIELAVEAGWSRANVILAVLIASEKHLEGLGIYMTQEVEPSVDGSGVTGEGQLH